MSHWIIVPVVLPALLAAFIVLLCRFNLTVQRALSTAGTAVMVVIATGLMLRAGTGAIDVYELGDWPAPFGIVLVADRLATMMVLLTSVLALAVVLYVIGTGWDKRGRHFHALFQFQLMGVCGAFLTGDAFNLFVFFEVLLIASYGLMIHSGGPVRLRAGMQYVVYNLLGSTLFLFALGTIYAVTGTLNMADLADRVAQLPTDDTALLRVGATLLILVFAVKAAVLPLHFWLPASYSNAPAPVAALFAIMTKVGAYAMLRFLTLVFPPDLEATQGLFDFWLQPAAMLTLIAGMVGVLGARRLDRLAAFAVIGSMGTLLTSISLLTPQGTQAALFYILHSTFASATLFLIVGLVQAGRGGAGGRIEALAPIARNGLVAGLFFISAIALSGVPPLSGFVGKLMVLDAARAASGPYWPVWTAILVTSLIAIVGFARAGSTVFWKANESTAAAAHPEAPPATGLSIVAIGGIMVLLVALTVLAGPVMAFMGETTDQLYNTTGYISAVLGDGEAAQ
ncbi:monovalent cation/H+ antiporter subunit D [Tranquillimonas rosea]|uniref:monovalent cation/H+ antiporter subunit D n=1 Tax=Tranquillimonas rosea TaxID=641238 RepID=UPI003BA86E19